VKFRDELTLTPVIGVWSKKERRIHRQSDEQITRTRPEEIFSVAERARFSTKMLKSLWKKPREGPQPRIHETLDTDCTNAVHR